jgi:hypothetical protein
MKPKKKSDMKYDRRIRGAEDLEKQQRIVSSKQYTKPGSRNRKKQG